MTYQVVRRTRAAHSVRVEPEANLPGRDSQ